MPGVPDYYRPRMLAQIDVPLLGTRQMRINQASSTESLKLIIHPRRFSLESNDHNHADSCEITADWTEAGVDPRMLDNAVMTVWLGNADPDGSWLPTSDNLRFVGLTKEIEAKRDIGSSATVSFSCIDYTTLFLTAKPFGSSGIPSYDQNLQEAWKRICSQTPGAGALADRLVLQGLDSFPNLGTAVGQRFKRLAKVPVHPNTDAWAVWQQCVGMMGLISYIHLDQCIVTTATNYYTESDSPLMIWGENLEQWSEVRHSAIVGRDVGCTAFDPLKQTTIEAFWRPVGDPGITRKRPNAKSKKPQSEDNMRLTEERDFFPIQGVTELAALQAVAKRIYEERSRQEFEGHFRTKEMFVLTENSAQFDMLTLKAGDTVRVEIDPDQRQILAALPSDAARMTFLKARGFQPEIALLIIKNMKEFARLGAKFHVHSVKSELALEGMSGSFSIDCNYVNRINIDGSADAVGA